MMPWMPPLIVLGAVFVYSVVHSLFASLWAKAQARRWFGSLAARTYRLVYNFFAAVTLLPVLILPVLLPDQPIYSIPFPWVVITLALQGLAVLALLAGLFQTGIGSFLGLSQLLQPPDATPPQLVINGLYRWVRHPLYTAGLVFIWLLPVMTWNFLALNLGLSAYLIIGAILEERKLVHEFGEAYRIYQRRTPMLIPRPPAKAP